jgi:predicted MFS family arabinose efflux permease
MLVPVAAHLAPPAARGRVVGDVMSGLLAGILLSRPVGSLLADHLGWRWVFLIAALATLVLAAALRRLLPERRPQSALSYGQLLGSMGALLRGTPILRRRAAYQSCMFAAFSLFWTTAPLLLASRVYRLSQTEIAFFALAGATGALVAPVAGRMADRGWTRPATGAAFIAAGLSFLLCWFGRQGALWALVCAGLILDLGVQTSQVLGQRAIYSLGAAERSRLNGLYVSLFFIGGALGSAGGGLAYALGGWAADCGLGAGICLLALALYLTEFRATPRPMAQAH